MEEEYVNRKVTEKEIREIVDTMKLEKRTNVKTLEQPKNSDFKRIEGSPVTKKGSGLLGIIKKDKRYVKKTNLEEIIDKELEKEEPNWVKIKKLRERIKQKKGKTIEESSYKTPLLEMIRADGRIEWYEGAKAGTLQINRSDEKEAYIDLRKDKLLTDSIKNEDGTVVQKWICYENDQNPLPANNYMDSHGYFSNLEEIMMAKKDWKTEQLKARGDLYMQIFIGIAIILAVLFVVPQIFGFSVIEEIGKLSDNTGQTVIIQEQPQPQYTPEEQQAIDAIVTQMRQNDSG